MKLILDSSKLKGSSKIEEPTLASEMEFIYPDPIIECGNISGSMLQPPQQKEKDDEYQSVNWVTFPIFTYKTEDPFAGEKCSLSELGDMVRRQTKLPFPEEEWD